MGTRKRRTSCGQPQATAIFPAHSRAASSSATSTTAKPPRCSLVSTNGPSVNSGVPLDASTLNTGTASSRPPVKMKTPEAFISATNELTALDFSRRSSTVRSGTHSALKAMRYSVMSPPLPGGGPAAALHLLYERPQPDSAQAARSYAAPDSDRHDRARDMRHCGCSFEGCQGPHRVWTPPSTAEVGFP